MATDKKISYVIQGHKKPARNYLGKQKTVKNIPIKWKSGPKAPATELAYITKAEKNLILKKDLHGSLKHGPNTGPDGIMSLDAQGDYTRDRSPAGRQSSPGGPDRSRQAQAQHEQALRQVLTGQVDRGQTSRVSDKVRRGAVPEYVNVKQPDGTYKQKYVGSAFKDTGRRGWLSKLFGGANKYGYGQTYGTGSGRIFDRKSSIRFNPQTGQYESEEENVGDIKPGWGGRILGGLGSLLTGIPFVGGMIGNQIDKFKPKTYMEKMSDDERRRVANLQMVDGELVDTRNIESKNIPVRSNVPMARLDPWSTPINKTTDFGKTIGPSTSTQAGDFISNLNDKSNMASGMQISNDQITSMNNLINQNNTTPFRPTDAMTGNYNTGAIPNRNRTNFNQFTGEWYADGGRAGYNRGRVVNPGGYQGDEFEDENTLEFMQDQGIPHGEMAEADPFEMRIQELMGKGLSYEDAYDIAEMEFQDEFAEGPEQNQEGIASLV